jgi:protein-S-isoprenylcysteine O-methyltransferase Ste14
MVILSFIAILLVALLTFLFIPYLFLSYGLAFLPTQIGILEILACILIIVGLCLFIWVIFAHLKFGEGTPAPFRPPKKIVASGAYRFSRNPMYVGALIVLIGEALLFNAPWMLLFVAFLFLIFTVYIKIEEEPRLIARFGDSYKTYLKKVPRWLTLKRTK